MVHLKLGTVLNAYVQTISNGMAIHVLTVAMVWCGTHLQIAVNVKEIVTSMVFSVFLAKGE